MSSSESISVMNLSRAPFSPNDSVLMRTWVAEGTYIGEFDWLKQVMFVVVVVVVVYF